VQGERVGADTGLPSARRADVHVPAMSAIPRFPRIFPAFEEAAAGRTQQHAAGEQILAVRLMRRSAVGLRRCREVSRSHVPLTTKTGRPTWNNTGPGLDVCQSPTGGSDRHQSRRSIGLDLYFFAAGLLTRTFSASLSAPLST